MGKRSKSGKSGTSNSPHGNKKPDVFKVVETRAAKKSKRVQVKLRRVKEREISTNEIDSTLDALHSGLVIKKKDKNATATPEPAPAPVRADSVTLADAAPSSTGPPSSTSNGIGAAGRTLRKRV